MEHRLITGGHEYLPFARSRIKVLRSLKLAYASQTFTIGGATVSVRVAGEHDFIHITAVGGAYQFATTGPVLSAYPQGALQMYKSEAVKVSVRGKKLVYEPIASMTREDTETTKRWKYTPTGEEFAASLPVEGYQAQNISQRYNHSRTKNTKTAWTPSDPLLSLSDFGGKNRKSYTAVDVMYDAAPQTNNKPAAPDADWYRQAARQTVSHEEFGSRGFFLMVDVANTLYVYPSGITDEALLEPAQAQWPGQSIKTNVPQDVTWSGLLPIPSWARAAEASARQYHKDNEGIDFTYFLKVPQHKWVFDSNGGKLCSVVFEKIPAPVQPVGAAFIVEPPYKYVDGVKIPLTENLPGMVEFEVMITLTGGNPEDFTVSVSESRSVRPSVDSRFIMAVDYSWGVKDKSEPNDLIIMQGEMRYPVDDVFAWVENLYQTSDYAAATTDVPRLHQPEVTIRVINETSGQDVQRFMMRRAEGADFVTTYTRASSVWQAGDPEQVREYEAKIVAFDLRVMAFCVQQKVTRVDYPEVSVDPVSYRRFHPVRTSSVRMVTHMRNKVDDVLLLDPDSSENSYFDTGFSAADTGLQVDMIGQSHIMIPAGSRVLQWMFGYASPMGGADALAVPYYEHYNEHMRVDPYGNDDLRGVSNVGAYLYSVFVAGSLALDNVSAFQVHPDKSWSLITTPACYFSGEHNGVMAKSYAGSFIASDLPQVDPLPFEVSGFKQARVDIISIMNGGKEYRTSHIEAYNKAFGTSVAIEDYNYKITKIADRFPGTSNSVCGLTDNYPWLPLRTPTTEAYPVLLPAMSVSLGGSDDTYIYAGRPERSEFSANFYSSTRMVERYPTAFDFRAGGTNNAHATYGAMPAGSAAFIG